MDCPYTISFAHTLEHNTWIVDIPLVATSFLEMDTSRERVLVRSILVVIVEGTVEEAVDIGGGN